MLPQLFNHWGNIQYFFIILNNLFLCFLYVIGVLLHIKYLVISSDLCMYPNPIYRIILATQSQLLKMELTRSLVMIGNPDNSKIISRLGKLVKIIMLIIQLVNNYWFMNYLYIRTLLVNKKVLQIERINLWPFL